MNDSLKANTSNWLPIETAPKSSRGILIYVPENKSVFAAYWGYTEFDYGGADSWRIFGGGYRESIQAPSHWMPMPEGPK